MEVLYPHEHLSCLHYDNSSQPKIDIFSLKEGEYIREQININQILFLHKGDISLLYSSMPEHKMSSGQFVFLPCGYEKSVMAHSESIITVFHLNRTFRLCGNFPLENLYVQKEGDIGEEQDASIFHLEMNEYVSHFLIGVNRCISGGLLCKGYFDLKFQELFILLRAYYTKEEIRGFFGMILSPDTSFSEYIRNKWFDYPTVNQLAASMNMAPKRFAAKFKQVFGQTAYQWIKHSKMQIIHEELVAGQKSLKQIAAENGFSTIPQFTNFCKKELGANPSSIRQKSKEPNGF